jgi:hypothetical protein
MQHILKLQHHRHTGKVLQHHHTSYRGIFVVLALVGIVLGMSHHTIRAYADEIVISAKISAPAPTVPATISTPGDNAAVTAPEITIEGTCEVINPAIIVAVYRAGQSIGSTTCQPDGTYSLEVTLVPGMNELVAHSINITNDFGPDSSTVHITYTPPPPITPSTTDEADAPIESPDQLDSVPLPDNESVALLGLLVRSERAFVVFGPDKPAVWQGSFAGGIPPYRIEIDWGDDAKEIRDSVDTSSQELTHTYQKMHTHYVTFVISDASGQKVDYHFAAVTPYVAPAVTAPLLVTDKQLFVQLYGAYAATVSLGFLAWYETFAHLAKIKHLFSHLHVGK